MGENKFTASAIDPLDSESTLMAQMIFAENAPGGERAWINLGNAAMNRLKDGSFGNNLSSVIKKMSSAIRKNDPQWEKASKFAFDENESRVFNKIKNITDGILSGQVPDTIKGATHFENLNSFPVPYWAKDMDAVATDGIEDKRWDQTYFRKKSSEYNKKDSGHMFGLGKNVYGYE